LWYAGTVKAASMLVVLLAIASISSAGGAGCGGAQGAGPAGPMVTVGPNDFVLRDVRKDAAKYINCQVPDIQVELGEWAGSEGNVTAFGCGYRITYYLRCITNHQCSMTVAD
jgi:hypothetical protein